MRKQNNKLLFFRKIRLMIIKIYRAKGSVNEIALGAGIGAFVSVFPTFGIGTPLVILLSRFVHFNLISALAASLISNPFTSPFFLYLSYKTGNIFIKSNLAFSIQNWSENIKESGLIMLLGSILISSTVSIIVFFTTKYLVIYKRNKSSKEVVQEGNFI